MKDFCLEFYLADSEYMTALRLAVGAVCATADKDVDSIEDMKVCVTESCLILKNCGFEKARVSLSCGGGMRAEVYGFGGETKPCDNDFSLALVSALVSKCDIEQKGGIINKIVLDL